MCNNNKLAIPKTSLSLLSQLQLLPCLTSYLSCFLLQHITTSKYSFIKQATLNEIYYHDSLMLTNTLNLALNLWLALLKIWIRSSAFLCFYPVTIWPGYANWLELFSMLTCEHIWNLNFSGTYTYAIVCIDYFVNNKGFFQKPNSQ